MCTSLARKTARGAIYLIKKADVSTLEGVNTVAAAAGQGCLDFLLYMAGLIQSLSQVALLGLSAWAEVGGIASSLCSKAFLPQPIST